MTHCAVPTSTLKSCSIAGSATFSAVKSLAITITPRPIAIRAITVPGATRSAPRARRRPRPRDRRVAVVDPPNGIAGTVAVGADGRELALAELDEQPRVVGADAVDARGAAEPRIRSSVVHGPGDQLEARRHGRRGPGAR